MPAAWAQWEMRAGASWRNTRSPAKKGSVLLVNAERSRPRNGARATSQGAWSNQGMGLPFDVLRPAPGGGLAKIDAGVGSERA